MLIQVTTPQASRTARALKFQADTIREPLYLDDAADAADDVIYSLYCDLDAEMDSNVDLQTAAVDGGDHKTADTLNEAQVELIRAMIRYKNALDSMSEARNAMTRYLRKMREI